MHLIGFIIRIYHDERSPERQIHNCVLIVVLTYFGTYCYTGV